MSNNLFIIGAGYSYDVAGIPMANQIIKDIYCKRKDDSKKTAEFISFRKVYKYFVNQIIDDVHNLSESTGTKIISDSKMLGEHLINVEYLLTIIDLNINFPYIPIGKDADLQSCEITHLKGINKFELKRAKDFIKKNIREILLPKYNKEKHYNKSLKLIKPNDTIITFNYDLLIEQLLWKKELWNPFKGYGFNKMYEFEKVEKENIPENKVDLIKLHGSVNWLNCKKSSISDNREIQIELSNKGDSYFDGLQVDMTFNIEYNHESYLIMPTFLKMYNKPFILHLVKRAMKAVENAKEIYCLGYSFPLADTISNVIFSNINSDARVIIVNPLADEIKSNLEKNLGLKKKNIVTYNNKIKDYIT